MTGSGTRRERTARGTSQAPRHSQGPIEIDDDVKLNRQYFSYLTDGDLIAGSLLSVMFTIDRSAADVWPYLRDFNCWQSDRYYSEVVGESEGAMMTLAFDPGGSARAEYNILRVIPEHVIVLSQPAEPQDIGVEIPLPGMGGVSRGFQVFMLNEHEGKTTVTVLLQHASRMATGSRALETPDHEAIEPWSEYGVEGFRRWHDTYIPRLKQLVYGGSSS